MNTGSGVTALTPTNASLNLRAAGAEFLDPGTTRVRTLLRFVGAAPGPAMGGLGDLGDETARAHSDKSCHC